MVPDQDEFVDIRLSDLLRDCSVGAIVRHGRTLMVVQDTRDWDGPKTHPHDREIPYVDLVRRSLSLEGTKLCRPPVRDNADGVMQGWVPARRFPEWTRCNRCGLLHNAPWREPDSAVKDDVSQSPAAATARSREGYRCTGSGSSRESRNRGAEARSCGGSLEQVPWVLVHESGYLADVPWHAIAHDGAADANRRACKPDWKTAYLRIENREGQRIVACSRCGARNRLRIPSRFRYGPHTRQQPWVHEPPPEPPDDPAWLVGVNDVRVHFAEHRTALVIPPESRIRRGTVVDRLYSSSADRKSIGEARTPLARRAVLGQIARKYRCERTEVERAQEELEAGYPSTDLELPRGELAPLEYRALIEPIAGLHPDEDFVTEHHSEEWRRVSGEVGGELADVAACVDRLVAVHRVKTIMVLDGFRRGRGSGEDALTPPDIVGESDWLPALELWGEGLFFTLDESLLRRWENQDAVRERAQRFAVRAATARLPRQVEDALSPRFLLCHTLAHLIIRRLEAESGYSAASLSERIYCADDDEEPMAGILIHVAVADEHGSLGGLMDMARPDPFLRLLTGAVEDAAWCSFDPVCASQEGHGPDLLNRAACHACALVPEPSCVCGNRLLDRAFVKGDGGNLRSLWNMEVGRD